MISIRILNLQVLKPLIFQGPSVEELRVANPISKRPYLERINIAHNYASAELLDLIVNKVEHCFCISCNSWPHDLVILDGTDRLEYK